MTFDTFSIELEQKDYNGSVESLSYDMRRYTRGNLYFDFDGLRSVKGKYRNVIAIVRIGDSDCRCNHRYCEKQ